MKTVLFVPGFQEDESSRDYQSTITAIQKKGYKVVFVPITWSRTTIKDWVKTLEVEYKKYDPKNTILAGFSFGAMTVFMSAVKKNPAELWLFSLSPYFAEDIQSIDMNPAWLKHIGKRRVTTFNALNFSELSQKIACKTLVFYGQQELDKWPEMNVRALDVQRSIKNNVYVAIPGVGHDVAHKKYISAIVETI
jgi:pimeloyl-ACP methyl ester carboxylesterase